MHPSLSPPTLRPLAFAVSAVAAGCLIALLIAPDLADAALKSAAGGARGSGGFSSVTSYLDKVATYLIPVGGALAVLGLIYGGAMFMSGNPQAGRILGYVATGIVIVLSSKGLAA